MMNLIDKIDNNESQKQKKKRFTYFLLFVAKNREKISKSGPEMTQIQMPKVEESNFKIPKKRKQKNTYRIISTGWNDRDLRRVRDSLCVFFFSSFIYKRKKRG